MAKDVAYQTATIASSATKSDAIKLARQQTPIAIVLPSAMTGTSMTFESSVDGGTTYVPVYNEGSLYTVNIGSSRHISLNNSVLGGVKLIKLVSTSTETAARSISVVSGEVA